MEAGGREGRSVHMKGVWPGERKVVVEYIAIYTVMGIIYSKNNWG